MSVIFYYISLHEKNFLKQINGFFFQKKYFAHACFSADFIFGYFHLLCNGSLTFFKRCTTILKCCQIIYIYLILIALLINEKWDTDWAVKLKNFLML